MLPPQEPDSIRCDLRTFHRLPVRSRGGVDLMPRKVTEPPFPDFQSFSTWSGCPDNPLSMDGGSNVPYVDLCVWEHRLLGGVRRCKTRSQSIDLSRQGPERSSASFRFLCLPEMLCDLNLYRAVPLVAGTSSPQRHSPCWIFVVVFPALFGKSFSCCVTASHLGRS